MSVFSLLESVNMLPYIAKGAGFVGVIKFNETELGRFFWIISVGPI